MEWLIWAIVVIVAVGVVLVETIKFLPSPLSQQELERRAAEGDKAAKGELNRRALLPMYFGVQRFKLTVMVLAMFGLLAAIYPLWLALLVGFALLLLVAVTAAMGWLNPFANWLQPKIEPPILRLVKKGKPLFKWLAPRSNGGDLGVSFASKQELKRVIESDAAVLSSDEKTRLLASIAFDGKKVRDAMVPASRIATVGQSETVGPLLLDKLHKTGHNVIVVVSKNLSSVKGLLYMSDLVPLDPDIKTVKDALRSKVFYIDPDAPLAAVLGASVKTGRQLFLVAKDGKTVGLVTLADALEHVLGERLAKDVELSKQP